MLKVILYSLQMHLYYSYYSLGLFNYKAIWQLGQLSEIELIYYEWDKLDCLFVFSMVGYSDRLVILSKIYISYFYIEISIVLQKF